MLPLACSIALGCSIALACTSASSVPPRAPPLASSSSLPAPTLPPLSPARAAIEHYDRVEAPELVPLLLQVLRFPTYARNSAARDAQQGWLRITAAHLGLVARDAGLVTEIDLPGPPNAPVIGLVVHGDVVPVEPARWSTPPFEPVERDGNVWGRGAADDKGPLVQALLSMKALRESGARRTRTIRLLVGSDEESGSSDIREYLKTHAPPSLSLVLDSAFPVVVGEKAWNALSLAAPRAWTERPDAPPVPYVIQSLEGGLSPSIVPDWATLVLRWRDGRPDWEPLVGRLNQKSPTGGTRLELLVDGPTLTLRMYGRAAHSGVNIEGGRNAIVAIARLVDGELPACPAADLLAFARMAGEDVYGTGLGLTKTERIWGRYSVNVGTLKATKPYVGAPIGNETATLVINVRRTPPRTGAQLREHLDKVVADFNSRTGAALVPGGYYADEPLAFDPECKIVKRLRAAYARAEGVDAPPAISGGGTYAKRLPNAIAFGMWFEDKPYPGHDVDEHVPVADLHRGVHVLLEAIGDLATTAPLAGAFER